MQLTDSFIGTLLLYLIGILLLSVIFMWTRRMLRFHRNMAGFAMSKWHPLFIFLTGIAVFLWSFSLSDTLANKIAITIFCASILGALIFTLWRFKQIFKYDARKRLDSTNHWFQLSILGAIAIAIILVIVFFNIDQNNFLPFSLFAVVLTWLFQDSVFGVATYIHLRSNGLLHIGDLIKIPEKNIEGYVADISLISVTIDSLDNTRAVIPIKILQTGSFVNLQNLLDGNTSGRRYLHTFTIDSRSISELSPEDLNRIVQRLEARGEEAVAVKTELKKLAPDSGILNIKLFRRYLRHWLCGNYNVARSPRMIISIKEPNAEGIPMEVYTFIKEPSLEGSKHISSDITEHILHSMQWFGLRLFQRPASHDVAALIKTSDNEKPQ